PTDSPLVVSVATPALSVTVPNGELPSLNVIVPLGVPAPGAVAVTVAVKVTVWPKTDGFGVEASVVAVLALFTVCVPLADVLALKLASPAYTAVTVCEPTASELTVKVATPPLKGPVPSVVLPSLN